MKQVEDMEARIPELEKKIDGLRRRLGEEKRENEARKEQEEDKVLYRLYIDILIMYGGGRV